MKTARKALILFGMILAMGCGVTSYSHAATTFFDFEDGTSTAGPLAGLNAYMDATFGSNVTLTNNANTHIEWVGESTLFGSDALFTAPQGLGDGSSAANSSGVNGIIDFEPGSVPGSLKITQVSFTWGVLANSGLVDFGLDAYDDITDTWTTNVFQVNNGPGTGDSGLITFDPSWKVTRIRFHDSATAHVGMDNLTVVSQVPEPGTIVLLGLGLFGLRAFRRKEVL